MGKIKRLLQNAWGSSRKLLLITMGKNLFEALIPLADILGIGIIIDALVTGEDGERIFTVIIFYVLVHSAVSLTKELFVWRNSIEARKSSNVVQYRYARQSLEVDFPYIQTGDFLDLKRKSMKIMPEFYIRPLGGFVSYAVRFIGILSVFTMINPLLILCVAVLEIPVVWMSFRRKKAEYQYKQDIVSQERRSDYLYKVMTEYSYAKDIRIYDGEELISDKYTNNAERQIEKRRKLGLDNVRMQNTAYLFQALELLCVLVAFSHMAYKKDISIAEYTVLLASTTLLASIVTGFFENLAEIKQMCAYVSIMDEYDSFISANSQVYHSENIAKGCGRGVISIDFEHVCFKYPGREDMALEDVSFRIAPGEKVSFVGPNGAGKTTAVKLLLRMYEPTSGTIRINGTDIKELSSREYYERIGIVLQDFFIFAYPLRENLCLGRKEKETGLEEALRQAGLWERVMRLPKGLDTSLYKNLDTEGVELSGGEGQKLAMARALCKDTGLLILDEPTSSLDPLAEYELFARMRQIAEGNTVIMVSHRLSSTRYSDRIFVFEGGRLTQSGSHGELMARDGAYRDLYGTQAKYYTGEGGLYEG